MNDAQATRMGFIITATLLVTSPIPGLPSEVRCKSRAQQKRLHDAERAASCALIGWPVDCVATQGEIWERVREIADSLPG